MRTKNRDAIDTQYERALAKEEILVREDSLNALYVAFTRARENLIIIKKHEKSTFDLLELKAGSWGELKCKSVKEEIKKPFFPLNHKEIYYGTQSDILALERETPEDLSAINFGIALHFMLEMMGEFKEEYILNAKNMMINKFGFTISEEEIADISSRVKTFIQSSEVKSLTDGECFKEKALRYKNNLRYVDLLVEKSDGSFNVIDYKSSLSYSEHHLKQVRYYVKAIREISGQNVEGFICYLLADEIKIVKV